MHALLATLLALAATAAPDCRPPAGARPVIDVHVHAYAEADLAGLDAPNPVTGSPSHARSEAYHRESTFCALQRHSVVRAVVSADAWSAVLKWKTQDPTRVVAGIGLDDPKRFDLALLRREHAAGRLQVLGEFGPQYLGLAPADPELEPVFALAEELDIPVAFHMHPGPPGSSYPPFGYSKMRVADGRPLLLEPVLVRHPKLRIYVMHAGYPYVDEMLALLYAHPQVYVDVGVIDWTRPRAEFHRYLQRLVEAGYGKRILFGSDQMVWVDAIGSAIEAIDAATFLTAEQKDDILYNNAVRFLRLPGLGSRPPARP